MKQRGFVPCRPHSYLSPCGRGRPAGPGEGRAGEGPPGEGPPGEGPPDPVLPSTEACAGDPIIQANPSNKKQRSEPCRSEEIRIQLGCFVASPSFFLKAAIYSNKSLSPEGNANDLLLLKLPSLQVKSSRQPIFCKTVLA